VKVFEGKRVTLEVVDGFEIVRHAGAAVIVPVDADGQVVLVRQERPAVGRALLELPAGLLNPGEEPLAAAQRELREETGLHGGDWVAGPTVYSSPGFTDERFHLFIATGLEEGENEPDEGEEIELVRVPLEDVPRFVGAIEDVKTLAGLLLLLRLHG
jgi:ADP-ribose pyrophosphatase